MTRVIQLPSSDNGARHSQVPFVAPAAPAVRTDTIYVLFTTVEDTPAAVRVADEFAGSLGAPITIVHFRAVPYALAVEEADGISPIETEAFANRLRAAGRNIKLLVYLCRDELRTVTSAFKPHSLIVIAGRRSWWPTHAERLRRALEAAGHFVVFVDPSEHAAEEASHA
jgi:hypothetical protein